MIFFLFCVFEAIVNSPLKKISPASPSPSPSPQGRGIQEKSDLTKQGFFSTPQPACCQETKGAGMLEDWNDGIFKSWN
jgi:hypothetical protein